MCTAAALAVRSLRRAAVLVRAISRREQKRRSGRRQLSRLCEEASQLALELGRLPWPWPRRGPMRAAARSMWPAIGAARGVPTQGDDLAPEGSRLPARGGAGLAGLGRCCGRGLHAGARALLELLAFFAPDALPRVPARCRSRGAAQSRCATTLDRDSAIAALTRFSLLRAEAGSDHGPPPGPGGDPRRARRGDGQGPRRGGGAAGERGAAAPDPGSTPTGPRSGRSCRTCLRRLRPPSGSGPAWRQRRRCSTRQLSTTRLARPGPRPSRSSSAPSRSARRRSAPSTPTLATRLNNLAELYQATGRYAEAEPLYRARHRHRREGPRPRAPRPRQPAQQPGRALPGHRPLRRGRAALSSAPSRSARRRSAPSTPTSPSGSTTWPCSTRPPAATPRPSRSSSAPWRSARRPSAPSTPTSPPAQQPGRALPGHRPLRRGRAALRARPGDPREDARPRAPRRRQRAQQPGHALPGHRPLRRGRAALSSAPWRSARRPSAPSTRRSPPPQQLRPALPGHRPLRRGRAALSSAPSRSARRPSAPSTPTSPSGSTTWPSSTRPPAAMRRPSRSSSAPSRSWTRACRRTIRTWRAVRENYAPVLDRLGRGDEAAALRAEAEAIRQRREQAQAPSTAVPSTDACQSKLSHY